MTRVLKYRAWDIESPAMLSWEEIQEDWRTEGYEDAIFRQDHYHVMQFTGLTDRNGVEIYSGDIVLLNGEIRPRFVSWNTDFAAFCFQRHSYISKHLYGGRQAVVIGNIHENPELLA